LPNYALIFIFVAKAAETLDNKFYNLLKIYPSNTLICCFAYTHVFMVYFVFFLHLLFTINNQLIRNNINSSKSYWSTASTNNECYFKSHIFI